MNEILDYREIVERAACRIAYKMDAWEELEDLRQEMWLEIVARPPGDDCSSSGLHRRLGSVGARYILSQKNLGMVMEAEQSAEALSSPLDRELVEWALPQLERPYRNIIRSAMDRSDQWPANADLKDAFKALSEVVSLYER